MILPDPLARTFIRTYRALLDTTTKTLNPQAFLDADTWEDELRNLHTAREALLSGELSFDEVLSRAQNDGTLLDDEAIDAIRRLRLQRWIFLRDTRGGSVMLESKKQSSYLVLGLTQPLRELTGQSGIVVRTAIAPLRDVFFSDGLLSTLLHIGPNMRGELNERQQHLRNQGLYFKRYDENASHFPVLR